MNPYVKLCFAIGALLAAFACGCKVEGWRLGEQIAQTKAQQAGADATAAREDLTRYKAAADQVTEAASAAATSVSVVRAKIAAIQARPYAAPLPIDCRPDADRLRARNAAIDAYNAARAGSNPGR